MDQIDWQAELRKIEREYDGLPPEPSRAEIRAQRMKDLRAREEAEKRVALFGASARLVLVGLLLGALWWWPYRTSCGLGVGAFVAAQSMVVVGGLWTAVFSWQNRLGASHALALGFLVTGLALVAVQVLPRFGLVTVSGMHATGWRCTTALPPDQSVSPVTLSFNTAAFKNGQCILKARAITTNGTALVSASLSITLNNPSSASSD